MRRIYTLLLVLLLLAIAWKLFLPEPVSRQKAVPGIFSRAVLTGEEEKGTEKRGLAAVLRATLPHTLTVHARRGPGRGRGDDASFSNGRDFKKDWYSWSVQEGYGMFNPMYLPFAYRCEGGDPDRMQSLTFPALLGFKFDFVPDGYVSRHPAFVFRAQEKLKELSLSRPRQLARYIEHWHGTHAIGGELVQTAAGYKGSIVVCDRYGQEIFRRTWNEPRPYFELMGCMVKAWMEFRKQPVSPAMERELCRPMTSSMDAVREYGQSFNVPWRSDDEWRIYERIVQRYPDFAEVRFWYANQLGWDKDRSFSGQYIEALKSHIVVPAFSYMDSEVRNAEYDRLLDQAMAALPDHPAIACAYVKAHRESLSAKELEHFAALARTYSCHYPLISAVAMAYHDKDLYHRSLPLFGSCLISGYMTGDLGFSDTYAYMMAAFRNLGYLSEAAVCARRGLQDDPAVEQRQYLRHSRDLIALETLDCSRSMKEDPLKKDYNEAEKLRSFFAIAMALCMQGDRAAMRQWERTPEYQRYLYIFEPLWEARKALLNGKPESALALLGDFPVPVTGAADLGGDITAEAEMVRAEACLSLGRSQEALTHAVNAWYEMPRSRKTAYLLKRTMGEAELGRFAAVADFIFPKERFWRTTFPLAAIDDDKAVRCLYDAIGKAVEGKNTDARKGYWRSLPPFQVEYVALLLARNGDAALKQKAFSLYERYAVDMQGHSYRFDVHAINYLALLLQMTSKEDREAWSARLESDLERPAGGDGKEVDINRLLDENRLDEALRVYREMLRNDPRSGNACQGSAYCYQQKRMPEQALAFSERAIAIDPRCANAYLYKGNACLLLKREVSEIGKAYYAAVRLNRGFVSTFQGNSSDCFASVGYYDFYEKGDIDTAIEYTKVSLAVDPKNGDSAYNLACYYAEKKDTDQALRYLAIAVALDPKGNRAEARKDKDLNGLRSNAEFKRIVYGGGLADGLREFGTKLWSGLRSLGRLRVEFGAHSLKISAKEG